MLDKLKTIAPNVSYSVSREVDPSFVWIDDGPDPVDYGYEACNVTVTAAAIVNGELIEGHAYLGGSYFLPDHPCGDVHGYLPQMLEEANNDLLEAVRARTNDHRGLLNQIVNAKDWIKAQMRRRYLAQQGTH